MGDTMVTGRMPADKKQAGARVLAQAGLNASQAINLLYDRLNAEQSAEFLTGRQADSREWESAARFIDSIAATAPVHTRFDNMSRDEIKLDRLRAKGAV